MSSASLCAYCKHRSTALKQLDPTTHPHRFSALNEAVKARLGTRETSEVSARDVDGTYTEWGPAAAAMTVQWWWQTAATYHGDQSDWRTSRWRCRRVLQSPLGGSRWSRSWWSNCAGSWWNSTGFLFQWSCEKDERVTSSLLSLLWTVLWTIPDHVDSTSLSAEVRLKTINSQCEAEDKAVLPDDASPSQLQDRIILWSTVFSVRWVHLCKQGERIKKSQQPFGRSDWKPRMKPENTAAHGEPP